MTSVEINGGVSPDGCAEGAKRTWHLPCTDAFGRPYQLVITATQGVRPGIGLSTPNGEYAFVDVDDIGRLAWVINEARVWIGGASCIPNR